LKQAGSIDKGTMAEFQSRTMYIVNH